MKIKKAKKKKKRFLNRAKKPGKRWTIRVTVIPIVISALGTVPKYFEAGERVGNRRKNGNHPNYSIVEIGKNTEKSAGDQRRLAVTQTPVKDHQR